jgi:hypothetical protein
MEFAFMYPTTSFGEYLFRIDKHLKEYSINDYAIDGFQFKQKTGYGVIDRLVRLGTYFCEERTGKGVEAFHILQITSSEEFYAPQAL